MRQRSLIARSLLAAALVMTAPIAQAAPPDAYTELGRREAERIASGRSLVAVSASVDIGSRHFEYSDSVGGGYAPYTQPVAPMLSFGVEAYPAAASGIPVLRDLGLRGRVSRGFGFDSNTPQGAVLETSWTRFGGELRERLIAPGPHRLEVGLLVGMDANYFGIEADRPVPALLPAARTVALRFGADGELLLAWRLSMLLGAAYLHVTSAGEIYDQFRDDHLAGFDGNLGFSIALGYGVDLRLIGRYTRYFASFDPELGDRRVAGGALDQLLQVGLGARYAY